MIFTVDDQRYILHFARSRFTSDFSGRALEGVYRVSWCKVHLLDGTCPRQDLIVSTHAHRRGMSVDVSLGPQCAVPSPYEGVAACSPEDSYSVQWGRELALRRAVATFPHRGVALQTYFGRDRGGVPATVAMKVIRDLYEDAVARLGRCPECGWEDGHRPVGAMVGAPCQVGLVLRRGIRRKRSWSQHVPLEKTFSASLRRNVERVKAMTDAVRLSVHMARVEDRAFLGFR